MLDVVLIINIVDQNIIEVHHHEPRKISFITRMNVLGALDNPNSIINHSYNSSCVLNAVFHSSPDMTRI